MLVVSLVLPQVAIALFEDTDSGETRRKAKVLYTNLGICWAAKAAVSNLYVAAEFHLAS